MGCFRDNLSVHHSIPTQVDLDPLDGGTDAGFTFTSPNFPTAPPGGNQNIEVKPHDFDALLPTSMFYIHLKVQKPIWARVSTPLQGPPTRTMSI